MDLCFICKKPVFFLEGQATKCDTYLLSNEPEDQECLNNNAFGYCHFSCLISSKWGPFWAHKKIQSKINLGQKITCDTGDFIGVRNENCNETVYFFKNGYSLALKDKEVLSPAEVFERVVLLKANPIEYNFTDNGHSKLLQELQNELSRNGKYSLKKLVLNLQVLDTFLFPESIEHSFFKFNKNLKEFWSPSSFSADLVYFKPVPTEIIDFIRR